MINYKLGLVLVTILIVSCKKETDPFFDTFPKKFIFQSSEIVSGTQIFTNGKKITDDKINAKYINLLDKYINDSILNNSYSNDVFTFENKSLIKYSGHLDWHYDSLFYTKRGDLLSIKSEKIFERGVAFNCNSTYCHIFSWTKDSIGFIDQAGTSIFIYSYNLEYMLIFKDLYIPILGFYYKNGNFSYTGFLENEFNKAVIDGLTTDTLAIIEYRIKFIEQ